MQMFSLVEISAIERAFNSVDNAAQIAIETRDDWLTDETDEQSEAKQLVFGYTVEANLTSGIAVRERTWAVSKLREVIARAITRDNFGTVRIAYTGPMGPNSDPLRFDTALLQFDDIGQSIMLYLLP